MPPRWVDVPEGEANPLPLPERDDDPIISDEKMECTSSSRVVFMVFLRMYQELLSSQDGPYCQFAPSDSHFAFSAIKKYGIIQGTLMGSDRLMRCNPLAYKYYPLHYDNIHLYDPIENHQLWGDDDKTKK